MLRVKRQEDLIRFVNEKGIATIEEIMSELAISKATARRDINDLSDNGQLEKVRGGAKSLTPVLSSEPSLNVKSLTNAAEKKRIAQEAVKYIRPNEKIILDSGTTTLELAKLLNQFSDLTIVTNDIRIAAELNMNSSNTLILIGGTIRKGFCSSYGYYAEFMLKNITVDKIFLSVDAINSCDGILSYTMDDVNLKSIGMSNARETFLLCDHSKFNANALFKVGLMDQVSTIISGNELDPVVVSSFEDEGKNIIIV